MMRDGGRRKQRSSYAGEAESCPSHDPLHDVRKTKITTNAAAEESALSPNCRMRTSALDGIARRWDDLPMRFEILAEISGIETFATASGIREIARLRRVYGQGRWRKRKGIARVRLADGSIHLAEIHWYEAAGIGRKEFKIKHLL